MWAACDLEHGGSLNWDWPSIWKLEIPVDHTSLIWVANPSLKRVMEMEGKLCKGTEFYFFSLYLLVCFVLVLLYPGAVHIVGAQSISLLWTDFPASVAARCGHVTKLLHPMGCKQRGGQQPSAFKIGQDAPFAFFPTFLYLLFGMETYHLKLHSGSWRQEGLYPRDGWG